MFKVLSLQLRQLTLMIVSAFAFFAWCWHILIWLCNFALFHHFKHFYPLVPSVCTTVSILYRSCHLPSLLYRHSTCSVLSALLFHSFISSPFLHLFSSPTSPARSVIPPLFPRAAQRSATLSPVASWAHPTGGPKRLSVLQIKHKRTSNADPSSQEIFFSEALTLKTGSSYL